MVENLADHGVQVGRIIGGDDHQGVGLVVRATHDPVGTMPPEIRVGRVAQVSGSLSQALSEALFAEGMRIGVAGERHDGRERERDRSPGGGESGFAHAEA